MYLLYFEVVVCTLEFIPDGFQDGSKGSDPNSCPNQHSHFVLENIFTNCTKRTIHLDPGRRQKRIDNLNLTSTLNLKHPPRNIINYSLSYQTWASTRNSFLSFFILVWISSHLKDLPGNWWMVLFKCSYEVFCPVPCCSNMNREEIFLWSRGQSKGMPLQERDWGAFNKNILSYFHAKSLLGHL